MVKIAPINDLYNNISYSDDISSVTFGSSSGCLSLGDCISRIQSYFSRFVHLLPSLRNRSKVMPEGLANQISNQLKNPHRKDLVQFLGVNKNDIVNLVPPTLGTLQNPMLHQKPDKKRKDINDLMGL